MSKIGSLVASYLGSAAAMGYARSTLDTRRLHLREFADWAEACSLTPKTITPASLERYRRWLYDRRTADGIPLSWATHAHKLTAVRMLLSWATRTHRIAMNPAADLTLPRLPRRLPRSVLTAGEMERVLAQPDLDLLSGIRDRAMLELLYSTGIRRSELVALDLGDLDVERGILFVRQGKGGKDRVVPIGRRAIHWVLHYQAGVRAILARRTGDSAPRALFLGMRGRRIRPGKLTERFRAYIVSAEIPKSGSVHIFRHTMATLMHDGGADIRDLQEILGHAQLSTTEIYTHVSIERLKRVHARTHPADRAGHSTLSTR